MLTKIYRIVELAVLELERPIIIVSSSPKAAPEDVMLAPTVPIKAALRYPGYPQRQSASTADCCPCQPST
jgi:hypothetical protein